MKILIVYYQSFLIKDLEECLTRLGHTYKCIEANVIVEQSDDDFCALFDIEMESGHYDCVFTFNYSSIISDCMVKYNIPYISFVYSRIPFSLRVRDTGSPLAQASLFFVSNLISP